MACLLKFYTKLILLLLLFSVQCSKQVSVTGDTANSRDVKKGRQQKLDPVYFDYYKTVLTPQAMTQLYKVGYILSGNENCFITVEGHSDDGASESYERWLAEQRAKEVFNWLVSYGPFKIDKQRVIIIYKEDNGKSGSKCGNDEKCHARERRVDITVIY